MTRREVIVHGARRAAAAVTLVVAACAATLLVIRLSGRTSGSKGTENEPPVAASAPALAPPPVEAAPTSPRESGRERAHRLWQQYPALIERYRAGQELDSDELKDLAGTPFAIQIYPPETGLPGCLELAEMYKDSEEISLGFSETLRDRVWPACRDSRVRNLTVAARTASDRAIAAQRRHVATELCVEGLKKYPSNPPLLIARHILAREAGDWDALDGLLDPIIAPTPERHVTDKELADAWLERAGLYMAFGTPDQAYTYLANARHHVNAASAPDIRRQALNIELRLERMLFRPKRLLRLLDSHPDSPLLEPAEVEQLRIWGRMEELIQDGRYESSEFDEICDELEAHVEDPRLSVHDRSEGLMLSTVLRIDRGDLEAATRLVRGTIGEDVEPPADVDDPSPVDLMRMVTRSHLALHRCTAGQISEDALRPHLQALLDAYDVTVQGWRRTPILEGGTAHRVPLHIRHLLRDLISIRIALAPEPQSQPVLRDCLNDLVRAQATETLCRRLSPDTEIDIDIACERILRSDDDGILAFVSAGFDPVVFAIDRDQVIWAHVTGRSRGAMVSATRNLMDSLAIPTRLTRDEFVATNRVAAAAGAALGELLIPPAIADRIRQWRSIAVHGLDEFERIPLESLVVDGVALGQSHSIRYLPSIPLAAYLAARPTPSGPDNDFAFVAAPLTAKSIDVGKDGAVAPPIELSRKDALALIPNGATASVYIGEDATVSQLLSLRPEDSRCLVVFAHGARNPQDVRPARISLTPDPDHPDGLLSSRDLERAECAPLVVLAACSTAAGPDRYGGDGAQNLTGAFFIAGATTVIACPWDLEVGATRRMLKALVPALTRGLSPADAMLQARRSLADDPSFNHPALHSVWRVIGP